MDQYVKSLDAANARKYISLASAKRAERYAKEDAATFRIPYEEALLNNLRLAAAHPGR